MGILVTTLSTLRPSNGATLERLARISKETSLSSDHKMRIPLFLSCYRSNRSLQIRRGAWLGLYRKPSAAFYWIDDTPLAGQFSAWASGEPNDRREKCANMYAIGEQPGKWNDILCNLSDLYKSIAPVVLCQKYVL